MRVGLLKTYVKTTAALGAVAFPSVVCFKNMEDVVKAKRSFDIDDAGMIAGVIALGIPMGAILGVASPVLLALHTYSEYRYSNQMS